VTAAADEGPGGSAQHVDVVEARCQDLQLLTLPPLLAPLAAAGAALGAVAITRLEVRLRTRKRALICISLRHLASRREAVLATSRSSWFLRSLTALPICDDTNSSVEIFKHPSVNMTALMSAAGWAGSRAALYCVMSCGVVAPFDFCSLTTLDSSCMRPCLMSGCCR
jgi:hypothetical protein